MPRKRPESIPNEQPRTPGVPLHAIRKLAREIAGQFRPEKIILFGSYAYGSPHADSDVDLLVIMPARNMIDQAVRIRRALPPRSFPLDLIVRTPEFVRRGLEGEDWFLREIVGKGKVLHEARDQGVDSEGRDGLGVGARPVRRRIPKP
jgi:predicted nucleotidyltransferase